MVYFIQNCLREANILQYIHQWKAEISLALVALIWGSTFTMTKYALDFLDPLLLLFFRNLIAFLFLSLVFYKNILQTDSRSLLSGLLLGFFLFIGYAAQTVGLKYTTASNAGFITGLAVVIVPILSGFLLKKVPGFWTGAGVFLATIGLALISLNFAERFLLNYGDFLVTICSFAFAVHVVLVGKFAPQMSVALLTIFQLGSLAIACGLTGFATASLPDSVPWQVWLIIIFLALFATAGAFLVQLWAQKFTSPTKTILIFSLEPVFSAIFAFYFLQEYLTVRGIIGCGLIFLATILASLGEK